MVVVACTTSLPMTGAVGTKHSATSATDTKHGQTHARGCSGTDANTPSPSPTRLVCQPPPPPFVPRRAAPRCFRLSHLSPLPMLTSYSSRTFLLPDEWCRDDVATQVRARALPSPSRAYDRVPANGIRKQGALSCLRPANYQLIITHRYRPPFAYTVHTRPAQLLGM